MRRQLLFITLFVSLFSSPCHGLEILFSPSAEVTTHSITLGDIATFSEDTELTRSLQTQLVGQAPSPGQTVTLKSVDLKNGLVRKLSLPKTILWKGPPRITIHRLAMEVTPSELIGHIMKFLQTHSSELPEAKITFIPKKLPLPFLLPKGILEVEVLPSNRGILKSTSFTLILKVDGRVRKNLSLPGKIQALAPVAIATTTMRKGAVITPAHVKLEMADLGKLRKPIHSLESVVGKRTKRTIRAGAPLELSHIEFPPLIKKGDLVKIFLRHGALQLTATGIAKMNGAKDQIIRVMNHSSRKTIYCRVTAPGLVEVTL